MLELSRRQHDKKGSDADDVDDMHEKILKVFFL